MLINYTIVILSSLFVSMASVFLLKKFFVKHGVFICQGVPLAGGIAIALSFIFACLISVLFNGSFSQGTWGIILSSFIMLAFGVLDDWKELSISAKFLSQIIATALLIFFGVKTQITYIANPINIIVTFIWMLGISNAFNHLDVVDGVAAGTAFIVSLALFAVSAINGDAQNAALTLSLIGALVGFLIYNLPPAKVYMGNSGSHFLGFVLAAISLSISYASCERSVALFSPILILGFPIFDTSFLILMRLIGGRSALKKSEDHLALRFLKLGYSKNRTLFIMLIVAFFFSFCGVLVSQTSNIFGIIIILFVILLSLGLVKKMGRVLI